MGNVVLMKYVHKLKSELIFSFFFFLGLATNSENFENPWNAGILNVDPGKKFLVFLKKILGKLEEYIVQFQVIWELERLISNSLFCSASKFFLWPHCFFFHDCHKFFCLCNYRFSCITFALNLVQESFSGLITFSFLFKRSITLWSRVKISYFSRFVLIFCGI